MILLVVSMHAAVTYSSVGRWYYMEKPPAAGLELLVFITYQAFLQAFFMGFLFFIAGYFVPASHDKKGAGRFLRDRAIRLGLPTLLYVLVLSPVAEYIASSRRTDFLRFLRRYLTPERMLNGTGPLWFCVALLIFCCVYTLLRLVLRPGDSVRPLAHARGSVPPPRDRHVLAVILLMAVATFLVRTLQPIGTAIYNMQLCFFSQYVVLFAMGIQACRKSWLLRLPHSFGLRWLAVGIGAGALLWVGLITKGGALEGNLQAYNGGWHWQSAVLSLWESIVCAGVSIGLLVIFREKFSTQSRLVRVLSANAFAVYVLHPPVLIATTLAMRGLIAPPLVKFAVATAIAWSLTLLLSAAVCRQIPGLRRILA